MPGVTQGVYDLVEDVVPTMSQPYSEDIIEEVCIAIEHNQHWYQQYQSLCEAISTNVVNNWIGQYVKRMVGMNTIRQVDSLRSGIIGSYTKLAP